MEVRNGWPMQIYCSIVVKVVEKKGQVFYDFLHRCLKRINFLFKTPVNPFSPVWLVIRECFLSSGFCNNSKFQWALHYQWMYKIFWHIGISFPLGSSTGFLPQSFKSSGYQGCVPQTGAIRIRIGTHSCFIFSNLKIYWKGEIHKEDPCSNFLSMHMYPNSKDLITRLYIEVVYGIGGKQIDLLLENLVVEKPLEKLRDKEATLFFSWFLVCYCIQYWRQVFCCDKHFVI